MYRERIHLAELPTHAFARTFEEIRLILAGRGVRMSRSRVEQIHNEAMQKIRRALLTREVMARATREVKR